MNKKRKYSKNFEKRFGVKRNNFWSGVFSFFGLCDNPYYNMLKKISNRTAVQALQGDIAQLRNDCIQVIQDKDEFD